METLRQLASEMRQQGSLAIETLVQMEPGDQNLISYAHELARLITEYGDELEDRLVEETVTELDQSKRWEENPDGWLYTDGDFIFGWVRELGLHYYEASYPSEDYPILRLIGHFNSCTQAKNAVEQHQDNVHALKKGE